MPSEKQTPRQALIEVFEEYGLAEHCGYCECMSSEEDDKKWKADSITAILAVIKGLPAMQEETEAYEHVQQRVKPAIRNELRRQILAELTNSDQTNEAGDVPVDV